MQFLERISTRAVDRDQPAALAARDAPLAVFARWEIPDLSKLSRLAAITQPTLVAAGSSWATVGLHPR